jgi:cysteine synthase A
MLYNSILETVGRTPTVRLNNMVPLSSADVYVKLESFNPTHSIKDRAAVAMIQDAETNGSLRPGMCVVEPTSGNTGIGLAMVCAAKRYQLILTMPESMSIERRKLLKALGAEIVLTPASEGMAGAVNKAKEIGKAKQGSFMPMQFDNESNPEIHYRTTAQEILVDLPDVNAIVIGIGTGGTITGVGRAIKERKTGAWIIGVEPAGSPVLSHGRPGPHRIQGIGAGFVPKVYDRTVVEWVIPVTDEDAFTTARRLAKEEGILAGISSGAALHAALEFAQQLGAGKKVLAILPDTGERYLSTELFSE